MEKMIFSRRVAYELRKAGCRIIRTEVNKIKPQFDVWVFEDNDYLENKLTEITKNNNN